MNILKYNIVLYIYLFIVISLEWYYHNVGKKYTQKYDIMTLLLIEAVIILISVIIILLFRHSNNYREIARNIKKITIADCTMLLMFALYGIVASYVGLHFLQHHSVSKIRICDFIISIPISAFGLYYISKEKITYEKILGLFAVCFGGYIYMR